MRYNTRRITSRDVNVQLGRYVAHSAEYLNKIYGNLFNDWKHFPLKRFADLGILLVCYRDGEPVGYLAAQKYTSFFDDKVINLKIELLYSTPGTRASKLLLQEIIDIGHRSANHVYISVGEHTNIKQSSLNKLGFNKVEELFRLEI